jgi:hypothetical protein
MLTAVGVAAAVAVAVAFALIALSGGFIGAGEPGVASAAILRHADQAVSPPAGVILHTKVIGGSPGAQVSAEWWQLTSPPYASLGMKGPVGAQVEQADNGTTSSAYDPRSNTITEGHDASPPQLNDPVSQVRQELHDGQAQLLGRTTLSGVPVYEVRFASKGSFDASSLVVYFDQRTYRPILISDPQRDGTIVQLRVVTYEYLPTSASNLELLNLRARHPGARVEVSSSSKSVGGK